MANLNKTYSRISEGDIGELVKDKSLIKRLKDKGTAIFSKIRFLNRTRVVEHNHRGYSTVFLKYYKGSFLDRLDSYLKEDDSFLTDAVYDDIKKIISGKFYSKPTTLPILGFKRRKDGKLEVIPCAWA